MNKILEEKKFKFGIKLTNQNIGYSNSSLCSFNIILEVNVQVNNFFFLCIFRRWSLLDQGIAYAGDNRTN